MSDLPIGILRGLPSRAILPRSPRPHRSLYGRAYILAVRAALIMAPVLVLLSCASPKTVTVIETREVKVPVAIDCLDKLPAVPAFADTKEAVHAASNLDERVRLLLAGRVQRNKAIDDLLSQLRACVKVGPSA